MSDCNACPDAATMEREIRTRDARIADLLSDRREARAERDEARADLARVTAYNNAHITFRAKVSTALPREFGTTEVGAIEALRADLARVEAERDARPAITRAQVREYFANQGSHDAWVTILTALQEYAKGGSDA